MMSEYDPDLLEARVNDLIRISQKSFRSGFTGFFDEGGISKLSEIIKFSKYDFAAEFWGGHEDAERKMLGIFNADDKLSHECFPITALTITYKRDFKLTHRDFLGALMSLGLKRDVIGDILIEDGRCVMFVKSEIAEYICSQLFTVGRVGVKIEPGLCGGLPQGNGFTEISGTVASERLDCIVAALTFTGREKAASMIKSGFVKTGGVENINISQKISENTKVSVKGYGKFIVDRLGPVTRKGRLSFKGRKYK